MTHEVIALRNAAQQALEALDRTEALLFSMDVTHLLIYGEVDNVITALRAALAEPVQEPVDAHTTTLRNLLECCLSWEPDACVLGNVTARQAVAALRAALAQQDEPAWMHPWPPVRAQQDEPVEPVAWIQPDHLQKARIAPFLCRVEPTQRFADFVPLYLSPPQRKPQTLDEAMSVPRSMAQAYENGYKAGVAAERERIIQFLWEMQRVVGDAHNHYGVAAVRIKEQP